MKSTYDKDADALYIDLGKENFHTNKKLEEHVVLDLDKEGNVIGIEILEASKNIPTLLK